MSAPELTESAELEHLALAARVAGLGRPGLALPQHRAFDTDELRLHYVDWGGAGDPPLVFLHGGCLTARTWDLVCLALRDQHRCVAPDLRGHGNSDWSVALEYGPDAHARDLHALLSHLRLSRPVLVGQSLGGLNALRYAVDHSAELAGLVVVDVGLRPRAAGVRRLADFVRTTAELKSIEEAVARSLEFNPRRDPRLLRASLRHNLRRQPNGGWSWKYDPRMASGESVALIRRSLSALRREVESIECPALIVRGAESDLMTDADASELAGLLPTGRWTRVERAGHTVQGDNPRGLVAELRTFLAEEAR